MNERLAISMNRITVTHSAAAPMLPPIISDRYILPGTMTMAMNSAPIMVRMVNPSSYVPGGVSRLRYSLISSNCAALDRFSISPWKPG